MDSQKVKFETFKDDMKCNMHFCHMYLIQQKNVIKTKELYLKKFRLIFQNCITGGKIYLSVNIARLDSSWTHGQLKNLRFGCLNFVLISQKNQIQVAIC